MSTNYLQSNAHGTWEYEVPEGKTKVKYPIKFGVNELSNEHKKIVDEDLGFQKQLEKKVYKWLKGAKAKAAATADEDVVEKEDPKAEYKAKIAELKADHEAEMKKRKTECSAEVQKMVDLRGEALNQVKELEDENKKLKVDLSDFERNKQKEVDGLKSKNKDLGLKVNKLEKEIKDLKVKE